VLRLAAPRQPTSVMLIARCLMGHFQRRRVSGLCLNHFALPWYLIDAGRAYPWWLGKA